MHPLVNITTDISTNTWLTYWSMYWPNRNHYVGRYSNWYIGWHVDQHIDRLSVNILPGIAVDGRFDAWENFWIVVGWGRGGLTLFQTLAGGALDHLNYQHTGKFDQNVSKKSNVRHFAQARSMGGFRISQYKMQATDCCRPLFSPCNQNETKIVPLTVF